MRRTIVLAALTVLLFAAIGDAHAFTYTYNNQTKYPVRVTAQLYDDADKTGELQANGSYVFSSKSLLKSWSAEALVDNEWQQVLNMTCDLLPGNHTFSIYFDETTDANGKATRIWNALIK
ncbi:MAG TPA: hypothetical protein VMT71_08900 [Syntrophorhabdales bacterium]|nr:hypothetical protein [Syntrophorhabdales bacterium]